MKHRGIKLLSLFAILALMFGITGAVFAAPASTVDSVKIDVCHQDGQSGNYSLVNVDISSVDDANGLNGHGDHEGDAWLSFLFDEVLYPGQNEGVFGQIIDEDCNPVETEPEEASVSVDVGQCYWDGASYTDVSVDMTGEGTLTISGPGGPYVRTGDDTLTLGPGSYSWTFDPADGFELEGPGSGEFTVGECEPETDPASVSVELGSCRWDEQSGSQTPFSFDISGEGTFSINGFDYTSDGEILLPPGDYDWTFVPADGYHLDGPGSGSVEVLACEPPPPGGASATLAPFCGGGVNVTLANAVIFVQFGDQDPIEIDENGSYPLDLGDYIAWAEAEEGFQFPEGATTRWEFSIDRCPTGHEEPPTGPLDSIPLSAALPIAASGLTGLALLGSALRRKRH